IVNGGPYNSGVLAGGDHYDYDTVPQRVRERVQALAQVCAEHGVSLPDAALQFAAAHPVVVSVIAGARSADEVRANAAAMTRPAPAALWTALKDAGLLDRAAPTPEPAAC